MLRNIFQGIITTLLAAAAVLLCAFSVAYCSFVDHDVTTLFGILAVVLAYASGHSATGSVEPTRCALRQTLIRLLVISLVLISAFGLNFFSRSFFSVLDIELSLVVAALSLALAFAAGLIQGLPWATQRSAQLV